MSGGSWYKLGSLYPNTIPLQLPSVSRVEFRSTIFDSWLRMITIKHIHEELKRTSITLQIAPSPSTYNLVYALAEKIFNDEVEAFKGIFSVTIHFNSVLPLKQFKLFFNLISKKVNESVPTEIIAELEELARSLTDSPSHYCHLSGKHIISENTHFSAYINPDYNSMALVTLLRYPRQSFLKNKEKQRKRLKAVIKEFRLGASPDQREPNMDCKTLLQMAVYLPSEFFNTVLCYGPDPTLFRKIPHMTVFDMLIKKNDHEKYQTLISTYSRPRKSLSQKVTVGINNICMASSKQKITTVLNCVFTQPGVKGDKFIETSLASIIKRTDELTLNEIDGLRTLYNNCFPGIPVCDREKLFQKELSSNDTIIELIYAEGTLIGCNVYRIFETTKEIIFAWQLAMLARNYNGYGIMDLLVCRLIFALQLLSKKRVIWHFVTVHYRSYQRFAGENLHFPKYQGQDYDWNRVKDEVIKKMEYTDSYHDGIECHVYDGMVVNNFNKDKNIWSDLFSHIVGDGEKSAAFVLFPVGDDIFKKVQKILADIKISFPNHVLELLKYFDPFLKQNGFFHSIGRRTGFADSNLLFWKGVEREVISVGSNDENIDQSTLKKAASL